MADEADKNLEAAEKAYAAAAESAPAKPEPVKTASVAETPPAPITVAEPAAAKPAPLKAELVKTAPKAKKAAPAKIKRAAKAKPAAAKSKLLARPKAPAKPKPVAKPLAAKPAKATLKTLPKATAGKPIVELKEKIMAKTPDFTKSVTDAVSELKTKAKAAYDKSTEVAGEVTEFTKGNVEALVESGKIFSEGLQDMGKTYVEEAKSAFETATADLKEMAAVKSPTDLFQLQGKLMRRNFESMVAFSTKSNEAMVKLAKEGFAPVSSRVSLAADKVSKAA